MMIMSGGVKEELMDLSLQSSLAIPLALSPSTGLLVERPILWDTTIRIPQSIDESRHKYDRYQRTLRKPNLS